MSELDWTNKNIHPGKVVKVGQETEVMVLGIDEDRRRISLGIKQCQANPWEDFAQRHAKDDTVKGNIRSITDFGVFIGLEGGIDGLVHLSDLSWTVPGEQAVREYKKGQEVEAIILAIDHERERISLGIKQMESDPVSDFMKSHDKAEIFTTTVEEVEDKQALLKLDDGQVGILRVGDFSYERIDSLTDVLKVGETLDVKVLGIDRKQHLLQFSHKISDEVQQKSRAEAPEPTNTTLGDLLKEQMNNDKDDS